MTLWFLARAAGFVALLAATLSVTLGALGSGHRPGGATRLDQRLLRQMAHRSAGVVTLAMLVLHVALLVVDSYVDLSLPGVLVPFTAGYRGFALGLGTLAGYGLIVVAVTGAARGRLGPSAVAVRGWRAVHASAYGVWVLAMAHGLLAGTDTGVWWAWLLYGGCAVAVAAAGWSRLRAVDDLHAAALPSARRRLTTGGPR